MTLLLSLRCMALVFEEVRNLALGLAARGVDWATLGPFGGIKVGRAEAVCGCFGEGVGEEIYMIDWN